MSLIHDKQTKVCKSAAEKSSRRFYKNAVNTALFGVLCILGAQVATAQVAPSVAQTSLKAPPMTLDQVTAKSVQSSVIDVVGAKERDLRGRAMQEAALSFGARSGLQRRTYEINETINIAAGTLDAIWNFQPLMLTDAQPGEAAGTMRQRLIVPAIVTQARGIFKQDSAGLIHLMDARYEIESQPRFSSVVPSWRDYLFRDLGESAVNPPHVSLLPRTAEEKSNWSTWVAQGWESGVAQANDYLEYDLKRMKRDRDGMITYHEMVAKKMVSLPHVATSNEGVTGNGTTMNINDSMLRITVMPSFQYDSKNWVPFKSGN